MNEDDELRQELVSRWADVHKKSMTTLLVMVALGQRAMWSQELAIWLNEVAGWSFSERSLYRTLQRMADVGLIEFAKANAPKTGADRKVYRLTNLGRAVARDIKHDALGYMGSQQFIKSLGSIN